MTNRRRVQEADGGVKCSKGLRGITMGDTLLVTVEYAVQVGHDVLIAPFYLLISMTMLLMGSQESKL